MFRLQKGFVADNWEINLDLVAVSFRVWRKQAIGTYRPCKLSTRMYSVRFRWKSQCWVNISNCVLTTFLSKRNNLCLSKLSAIEIQVHEYSSTVKLIHICINFHFLYLAVLSQIISLEFDFWHIHSLQTWWILGKTFTDRICRQHLKWIMQSRLNLSFTLPCIKDHGILGRFRFFRQLSALYSNWRSKITAKRPGIISGHHKWHFHVQNEIKLKKVEPTFFKFTRMQSAVIFSDFAHLGSCLLCCVWFEFFCRFWLLFWYFG